MNDIFISYANEDEQRIGVLVKALDGLGWSVFWDHQVPPGLTWEEFIGEKLAKAKCVVVAWSKAAVESDYVKEEARVGKSRRVLVPVLLEPVEPPFGYGGLHAADLSKWDDSPEAPELAILVVGLRRILGRPPVEEEAEKSREAEEKAKRSAAQEEALKAEKAGRKAAEAEAERLQAEAAKRKAEEKAVHDAEEDARRKAEESKRQKADAKRSAEEKTAAARVLEESPTAPIPPSPVAPQAGSRAAAQKRGPFGLPGPPILWYAAAAVVVLLVLVLVSRPWWAKRDEPGPVAEELPTVRLQAQPVTIERGNSTTLTWTTSEATEVRLEPDVGDVALSGSKSLSPERDTTYKLVAIGEGGTVEDTVLVRVAEPEQDAPPPVPVAEITAQPLIVERGRATTLTWNTAGATEVRLEPGAGRVAVSGSKSLSPDRDTTYKVVAKGPGGTVEDSVLVKVTEKPPPPAPTPTAEITATPMKIDQGKSATLSWQTTAATSVKIEPGLGAVSLSGSTSVKPEADTVYKLTARGPGGAEEARVRVTVTKRVPRAGEVITDCPACPEMVVIPAGSFTMGSPARETGRWDDEGPQRKVTVRAFALGKHEVTRAEFAAAGLRAADCAGFRQTAEDPVVCVSWDDAKKYVAWLRQKTGEDYRLPSEAEWEYAARAGTTNSRYWGDSPSDACRYANVDDSSHGCQDGFQDTAPAGRFRPNRFGLYDVLGNVWEWVEDCWNTSYSGAPSNGAPRSAGDCSVRVLRGGSWYNDPRDVRSANRNRDDATVRYNIVGFRVARTLP